MMWAATPLASAASWGEVRNDWPITDTLGAAPSCLTISQTRSEPCSRLPASITAMVSMKARRARSMPTRRHLLDVEADDEIGDGVAELLARFGRLCLRFLALLRQRRRTDEAERTRPRRATAAGRSLAAMSCDSPSLTARIRASPGTPAYAGIGHRCSGNMPHRAANRKAAGQCLGSNRATRPCSAR